MTDLCSHRKMGVEGHCKEESARGTALSDAPGHKKLPPAFSCKFILCSAVAVNHTQESTYELWQLRLLENVEDPGMVDTGICGSKIVESTPGRRGENLALTIAQCQWTWCVWRSHDEAVVVDIGGLGNENSSARSKLCRNSATRKHMLISLG